MEELVEEEQTVKKLEHKADLRLIVDVVLAIACCACLIALTITHLRESSRQNLNNIADATTSSSHRCVQSLDVQLLEKRLLRVERAVGMGGNKKEIKQ
jgi:hypothetical protein